MPRPMPLVSIFAVVSLVLTGLFLIAILFPPLYNEIFHEERVAWDPFGVAIGVVYLVAAALFALLRSRLGLGLSLFLAMAGFTYFLSWSLSMIGPGRYVPALPTVVVTVGPAILLGVAIVGTISAAQRWGMLSEPDFDTALPIALLGGLGFALGLAWAGGEYASLLYRIEQPPRFYAIEGLLPLPHFVAAAALALRGRLAVVAALLVSVAGIGVALMLLVALVGFGGAQALLDSVAIRGSVVLWSLFLMAYGTAGSFLWLRLSGESRALPPTAG